MKLSSNKLRVFISFLRYTFLLSGFILWITLSPRSHAHGGVIIDGGSTEEYEWLALASPYPVTPGETVISVQIYDIATYAPVNGLQAVMEFAPPGSPQPCCQGDGVLGPLPVIIDPELYPGDYSTILLLLQEGDWQVKFSIPDEDVPVDLYFTVQVNASDGSRRPTPVDADIVAATATALFEEATPTSISASPLIDANAANASDGGASLMQSYPLPADSLSEQIGGEKSAVQGSAANESSLSQPGPLPIGSFWRLTALAILPVILIIIWFLLRVSDKPRAN